MEKTIEFKCDNCDSEFKLVYDVEIGEPISCPFCGGNIDILSTDEELKKEDWED